MKLISVSPPLAGLMTALFSQCRPRMALQVRYLAPNLHRITYPSLVLWAKPEGVVRRTRRDLPKRRMMQK